MSTSEQRRRRVQVFTLPDDRWEMAERLGPDWRVVGTPSSPAYAKDDTLVTRSYEPSKGIVWETWREGVCIGGHSDILVAAKL